MRSDFNLIGLKVSVSVSFFLLLIHLPATGEDIAEDANPSGAASQSTVEHLVQQAVDRNPQVRSVRLKWEAASQRPDIAGALPDPMVTYGRFFQNIETRVGPMENRVTASQRIPFPGKRSLAEEKARKEARLVMWEYQQIARQVMLQTRLAAYDLYRIESSHGVLEEQKEILQSILENALARYETAQANSSDVLKTQVAIEQIHERLLSLNQVFESARSRLNALRDQPAGHPVPSIKAVVVPEIPDREQALHWADEYRQELRSAGVAVERDELGVDLARRQKWPDFTFGIEYTQIDENRFSHPRDNGKDAVAATVGISIPLWFGKYAAMEREAARQLEASEAAQAHTRNMVHAEVHEAWNAARFQKEQLELYAEELIPRAEESFEAVRAGYQAGKTGFIDLLDSQRALLTLQLGEIGIRSDLAKSMARLQRAMGIDLSQNRDVSNSKSISKPSL